MVGVANDCLANPLGAIRPTFEKAIASGSDPAFFSGKDWGAVDLFRSFLYDDDGLSQVIENDLVAARQEDRTLGTQDFSRLLTMGRLMSMSFGETSLSLEHWQMVKELERLRRERLK